MAIIIYDPMWADHVRLMRSSQAPNARDEMWDGMLVMPPMPNNEHQDIVIDLAFVFKSVVSRTAGDRVHPGANVSDRDAGWRSNYREPDVVVYLATNPAADCATHWFGGPDLAVEVVSPGEDARLKLDFYAKVSTRELLVVDRDPWLLELYQLQGGKLISVGTSDAASGAILASCALPLTFRLQAGVNRPLIHIAHMTDGRTWTA